MAVPSRIYVFLAVGFLAASQSGNIIRLGTADPFAIAAWRLLLAGLVFLPFATRKFHELIRLTFRERVLLGLAGVSLALHFFTWIAAVQNTTVANAAIFFAINPVFVAAAGFLFLRERVGRRLWLAILLGIGGVVIVGIDDLRLQSTHLTGDLWAVASAAIAPAYFLLGRRLRRVLSTEVYVTCVYLTASALSFFCLLLSRQTLVDYDTRTWVCFLLMALVPTVLGHSALNHALRYVRAGWISALTLTEPLMAGLVAYFVWDEGLTIRGLMGYGLIAASVLVLARDRPDA